MQAIPMNIESIIFDPQTEEGRPTINGIPAGFLSPNFPRIVGADGQPQQLDIADVVKHFHGGPESQVCVYTGNPSEGVNVLDGNPKNFLITNLEPVCKAWMDSLPFVPKAAMTKTIPGPQADFEVEIYGAPLFRVEETLNNLVIPEVPGQLGLAHAEAELLWVWNHLTKVTLLKGLKSLTRRNKQTGVSVTLDNMAVLEFTFKLLHNDFTPQENK